MLYTSDLLRQWKRLSEEAARLAIETRQSTEPQAKINDVELVRFFALCFDRPAFQDAFHQEGSMEAFDRAMEDTLTAINTGCLRSRDGGVLQRSWGKAFLTNSKWRERMDVIADLLRAIQSRYEDGKKKGAIHVNGHPDGTEFYCIHDRERLLIGWIAHDPKSWRSSVRLVRKRECMLPYFPDTIDGIGSAGAARNDLL